MKVLLVEDEVNVASFIQRGLSEAGYEVTVAMDGILGYSIASEHEFAIILLDIMLPGMNGLDICRKLREANVNAPILMLTALGSTENVVTGLDSGADDYLVKPFKFAELQARIRSLTRRNFSAMEKPDILSIDDLQVDANAKTVQRGGKTISLTATEYRLLEFMLKNQRKVLSRMEILEHVWGIDFNMGTNVVDVYVNYLRKKLDKGNSSALIHTVIGMGYILKETHSNENSN
ncbi:two component transcriptional regulator, winged helix family [Filimonas lacunae]|uniref:Two component transcriptional regulator, winged helix family n=1 Tax=Filimonas lacunae TaxID=477680 RepID=A0A173M9J6_9BACT|nr:response regulator transcription factor [Filimonas lacunae]BAV04148.1 two-component system response regulator [Filimonas lacunae]SIT14950.1 two component transcriptional regulator, winged helix family [Filimonas lacunae]